VSGLLSGKTGVITGASRGLGLAMAAAFGAEGAAVVIGSRSSEAVAEAVGRLEGRGIRATGLACDVTAPSQITALAEHARRTFGGFDIWVNNAGISAPYGPTAEVDPASFEQVVATNILGVYYGSMAALRHFLPQGSGKLINLLGRGDRQTAPYQSAYGSSKSWIRSFSLTLAREYRDSGIGIYAFNPGLVRTDLLLRPEVITGHEHELSGFYVFLVDAWASPPEVPARKAVWLASRASDGKTGLVVNLVGPIQLIGNTLRWLLRRARGNASRPEIQPQPVPPRSEAGPVERITQ
jgi:NAD(P)-dependent dehydrogenase (short-subunit alcohol dehydrogenase family)